MTNKQQNDLFEEIRHKLEQLRTSLYAANPKWGLISIAIGTNELGDRLLIDARTTDMPATATTASSDWCDGTFTSAVKALKKDIADRQPNRAPAI